MGIYLNPGGKKLEISRNTEIYVDKSGMLSLLNSMLNTENRFVCISRPRRFGKSMIANLISAYYDHTVEDRLFAGLRITGEESYSRHRGKYDVIKLNMQEFLSNAKDMAEMLDMLRRYILWDLLDEYSDVRMLDKEKLTRTMMDIYRSTGRQFIIIIDEWDCIFREKKNHKAEQDAYLDFLRDWLKDKDYKAIVPDLPQANLPLGLSTRREILAPACYDIRHPHL